MSTDLALDAAQSSDAAAGPLQALALVAASALEPNSASGSTIHVDPTNVQHADSLANGSVVDVPLVQAALHPDDQATGGGVTPLDDFLDLSSVLEEDSETPPSRASSVAALSRPQTPISRVASAASNTTSTLARQSTRLSKISTLVPQSVKSFGKKSWKTWKKVAPVVHAILVVFDLLIFGWEVAMLTRQTKQNNQTSVQPLPVSNVSAALRQTKEMEAVLDELHLLRTQLAYYVQLEHDVAAWDRTNTYIQTCLMAMKVDVVDEDCQAAIRRVGVAPPLSPTQFSSITVQIDRRGTQGLPAVTSTLTTIATQTDFSRPINYSWPSTRQDRATVQYLYGFVPTVIALALLVWKAFYSAGLGKHGQRRGLLGAHQLRRKTSDLGQPIDQSQQAEKGPLASAVTGSQPEARAVVRRRRPVKTAWQCAFKGDTLDLLSHLDQGLDIDSIDPIYGSILAAAAQGGQKHTVESLLGRGAKVGTIGGKFGTALQAAASSNCLAVVDRLLQASADINATAGTQGHALSIALRADFIDAADRLLQAGADIHIVAGPFGTALQSAASRNMPVMVERLIQAGANVNSSAGELGTALQIASQENNMGLVSILLDSGADLEQTSGAHGTALQIASRQGYESLAEMLIARGAKVDLQDEAGKTPLHEAARLGKARLAKVLLERQTLDINTRDNDQWTPLHHAACYGFDAVLVQLLERGADVEAEDKFQAHALFRAAGLGHTECVRLLLKYGSPVNAVDTFGRSALHGPPEGDDVSVPFLLLEAGAHVNLVGRDGKTALHEAAHNGNLADVKLLLSRPGVKTCIQDNDQATPLLRAVARCGDADPKMVSKSEEIVSLLLARPDADVNARSGSTFQEAILSGNSKVVEAMIAANVTINMQGGRYGSAVGAAAFAGNFAILQLLVSRGATVNLAGGEFGTALQAAATNGHVEATTFLLFNAAAVNAAGGRHGGALNGARAALREAVEASRWDLRNRLEDVVQALREAGAEDLPLQKSQDHREDRWVLTPGGWGWLPKGNF